MALQKQTVAVRYSCWRSEGEVPRRGRPSASWTRLASDGLTIQCAVVTLCLAAPSLYKYCTYIAARRCSCCVCRWFSRAVLFESLL